MKLEMSRLLTFLIDVAKIANFEAAYVRSEYNSIVLSLILAVVHAPHWHLLINLLIFLMRQDPHGYFYFPILAVSQEQLKLSAATYSLTTYELGIQIKYSH